jgi:hypothetical protein
MNTAILIGSDDWEGLFVNDLLVEEGHTLNEGSNRIRYFTNLAKKYNFNLEDMQAGYVTEEYENILNDNGCFDSNLNDVGYTIIE